MYVHYVPVVNTLCFKSADITTAFLIIFRLQFTSSVVKIASKMSKQFVSQLLRLGAVGMPMYVIPFWRDGGKDRQKRQLVYMWGKRECIPQEENGFGIRKDLRSPQQINWFNENKINLKKFDFGTNFGAGVTEGGDVYVWGCIEPDEEDGSYFIAPFKLQTNQCVLDAQCSLHHLYILGVNGDVFVYNSVDGVLRQRYEEVSDSKQKGGGVASTVEGRGCSSVSSSNEGVKLSGGPAGGWLSRNQISSMCVGDGHAAFLTNKGELYCIGDNKYGQCGVDPHHSNSKYINTLQKVNFGDMSPPVVTKVACGGSHTVALTEDGNVYTFGDDSKLQLLLGDTRSTDLAEADKSPLERSKGGASGVLKRNASYNLFQRHLQHRPQKVVAPSDVGGGVLSPPLDVVTGQSFTILKYKNGDATNKTNAVETSNVLMCGGQNIYGQCGRTLSKHQQTLNTVKLPLNSSCQFIACGSNHCLSKSTSGDVYSWGFNNHGQTGTGKTILVNPPKKLNFEYKNINNSPPHHPNNFEIIYFGCGFDGSGVIVEQKMI